MSKNRLNGWQRLWVVACVLYGLFSVLLVWKNYPTDFLTMFALWWLIPCVLLYALGWSLAWVLRGFKTGPSE